MKVFRKFIDRVTKCGKRRAGERVSRMMGRERVFEAWDLGADTFVFERGVAGRLADRPSVLAAKKRDLGGAGKGFVMTISTGNHAVAAFPLLDGRFWHLARLDPER
ncbi:MAG: hypothetical protein ILO34_07995, partial [Kiritimatiellae bacterium]|nr:hypothetical protein [Kiritimatiellia bacterium]